ARLERRHRGADLDDRSHCFVSENRPGPYLGNVALQDVKVGPANRGRVDPDDHVGRLLNFRVRLLFPAAKPGPVVDERLHGTSFRLPSMSRAWVALGIGGPTETPCGFSATRTVFEGAGKPRAVSFR